VGFSVNVRDAVYPEICRLLSTEVAGSDWRQLVLDARVGDHWARFQMLALDADGVWRSVEIHEVPALRRLFHRIRESTSPLADGERDWTAVKMTLMREGGFSVEFVYAMARSA
jgi:hypothetical protein